ncbi:MAG: S8 family serine peptidase [Solirubrobacterales bacterium]
MACTLAGPAEAAPHHPGELIVKYRVGTTGADRDAARRDAGVRLLEAVDGRTQRVEASRGDAADAAAKLTADPRVVHAVPNYVARASAFTPNDPGRGGVAGWAALQWNFAGPFGIGVQTAWDNAIAARNPGGGGVIVAVLDTGVAYRTSPDRRYVKAPDLDRSRFVRGYDFVRNNSLPYDRNGHGTFVAGVIAQSTNNGIGLAGVAYRARIMPIRVLDYEGKGDVATIARGIRLAARRGARVINMSFEFDIGLTAPQIPDVLSAVRFAHRKGAVLVAAAGNTEETRVAYPARAKNVVAVGATTEHGCVADYSNTGPSLSVVAPGGGADAFVDADPNCKPLEDPGRDVYQYTFRGTSPRRFGLPSGYEGTSMAVPHVSGTAALIIGTGVLGPDPSPGAIQQRIQSTARDLGPPGYDMTYGYGLLSAGTATAPLG